MIRRATAGDAPALAALHAVSLPSSLLSMLGSAALVRYYEMVIARETVWSAVDGQLVGGCVLCDEPQTVLSRFVRAAPFAFARELTAAFVKRGDLRRRFADKLRDRGGGTHTPEVTQIFTDARRRGGGIGAQLLRTCEATLRERGVPAYYVHTEREDNEAGIRFYRREGFVEIAWSRSFGVDFLVMRKDLDA